ncbi:MAG TPA: chemotaxis protein CheB [Thermoanaerobaculia bacterium]
MAERKAKQRAKVSPEKAVAKNAKKQHADGNGSSGVAATPKSQPVAVVGVGASAGGLDAFRELLQNLPADSGMAFVIVQHLAQNQKSMLPDILARSTTMPVTEVVDATPVLANRVYVMSAQADVEYAAGALILRKRQPGKKHMPVDRLFMTLAEGLGELSVAVILSGTDGDGSTGAQHIKAAGGLTFAQDDSAQFDGMPQSAIDKGTVDFILSPREIAHKLMELAGRRLASVATPSSTAEFDRIIQLLSTGDRIDFLHYKTPTIERRIQRRMLLQNITDLAEYRRQIEEDPAEREALYRDVLIGVTRFFRDPARSAALTKKVFPMLLDVQREAPLRFWVPGCSTGEEVYSLSILLLEYLTEKKLIRSVQIFGSDIREDAIAFARAGIYPKTIEDMVSQERLQRFFTPAGGGRYSIARSIRELCVFAEHNLLKDPPFSRLDLISCSNLLIYLQPEQQERVAAVFRYALNGNGLLILGPSETLRANTNGFVIVDKKSKLYRVAPGSRPRLDLSFGAPKRDNTRATAGPTTSTATLEEVGPIVDRLLLQRYTYPSVVVNDANDVLEFRGDLQPYLAPASGTPSFKLSKLIHPDLLIDVHTALFKARQRGLPVRRERVKLTRGTDSQVVNLEVIPAARSAHDRIYVIAFETVADSVVAEAAGGTRRVDQSETERLQNELKVARDYMSHLTNEHEQSDSVLNATSEELQSANEELQSTIEELETAKEELQSTNEELSTLNDELRLRNADLVVLGDDLMNLLSSIDTPVIMVDRDLVLRLFNPTAERLFSFRQTDAGRAISAFKPLMDLPDLGEILRRVVETAAPADSEVQSHDGRWYSLRVRPYRSSRNEIAGAVITLVDIHDLRSALTSAEESRDLAERARTFAEGARTQALEANRIKDEFLSTLSHELRTPMTSILGWAQMMRMMKLDKATMATAVATIERGTYAQIRLIDDLLDISRITNGRLRVEERLFRLPALVTETLDVIRPAITAKEIAVRADLDRAPALLYGDPDRLRQVIWNLLSNAVKFTPAGGSIEIAVFQTGGSAVIRVTDTGEGIAPEFLPRVFERFWQGDIGSKREKPGLGLGLAISKYVVDLHGGTIEAESAGRARGATFTVTLPLVPSRSQDEVAVAHAQATTAAVTELPTLNAMKVLVVDDDPDSLKLVGLALEHCGATILQATSVESAISHLEQSPPDVIISDIAMPNQDGFDLVRHVRALSGAKSKVPMVALTAFTSADDRRRILAAGFNTYFSKPVAPLELMQLLAKLKDARTSPVT